MSSLPHSVVTWTEFLRLPERPENAKRYELHDGEVIIVPPPRPLHLKVQKRLQDLLEPLAGRRGVVPTEFPYRPAQNLQYWVADLAYVPRAEWDAIPPDQYPIYAPPFIVEILSPSNTQEKINRQKMIAMSAGTKEFWVVDAERKMVHVTTLKATHVYGVSDSIPVVALGRKTIAVKQMFAV
jgi:Uma2 family endonuclease